MRVIKNHHNACQLSCQLVLICYRRKPMLVAGTTEIIEKAFATVGAKHDCQLDKANGESDHIHLLFSFNVTTNLAAFVSSLKSCSSRLLKAVNPDFKWSAGYWISTVGAANEETIKNYIDNQGKER